jgi:hypothetical protein
MLGGGDRTGWLTMLAQAHRARLLNMSRRTLWYLKAVDLRACLAGSWARLKEVE